jgi:predicted metal-dependent hydrolase
MGDDLVPEEVEVDPFGAGSTFRTTEHTAVKGARPVQVVNGKGQVETRSIRHGLNLGWWRGVRWWGTSIASFERGYTAVEKRARQETLKIGGKSVAVNVRLNPRARRLIVKVHPSTGEVAVVAPSERSVQKALDFARQEGDWIAGRLDRVPEPVYLEPGDTVLFKGSLYIIRLTPERGGVWIDNEATRATLRVTGKREHAPRRVEDWLKRQARAHITRRIRALAEDLGVNISRITVRDATSRWGSCSTTGAVSLSWRLIMAPNFVLNYVAAHEVAHLREMNHGTRFWRIVDRLVGEGEAEAAQTWLRENGTELHRYTAQRPKRGRS